MTKFFLLSKVLFKNSFANSTKKQKLLYLVVFIALLPSFGIFFGMFHYLYQMFAPLGMQSTILNLGLFGANAFVFILAIFYIPSLLFFSNDNEGLLYLPFTPYEIAYAKLALVLPSTFVAYFSFALPCVVLYLVNNSISLVSLFLLLLAVFIPPLMTILLAAILSSLLTRLVPFFKNKDVMMNVMMFVILGITLGINYYISSTATMDPALLQELLLHNLPRYNELLTMALPYVSLFVQGAIDLSFSSLLLGLCFFGGVVALFSVLVHFFLFDVMTSMSGTTSKKKKLSRQQLAHSSSQKNIFFACVGKEVKTLLRTPVFFQNCVLINYLLPVILVFPLAFDPAMREQLQTFTQMYLMNLDLITILLLGFAIGFFFANINMISATALSRTGNQFYLIKMFPIAYHTQIHAKIWTGILFGFSAFIIVIPLAIWLLALPLFSCFLLLLFGFLGVVFGNYLGFIIDLVHPYLQWTNEIVAVKQNMNALIMLLISMTIGGAMIALVLFNPLQSQLYNAIILLGTSSILSILLYLQFYRKLDVYIDRILN